MTTKDDLLNHLYQRKVVWLARRADAVSGEDIAAADARLARLNESILRIKALPDGPLERAQSEGGVVDVT